MMRPLLLILLWLLPSSAQANDGLITIQSAHSAPVTIQRLQDAIAANGWIILSKIDHAAHAAEYGVKVQARTTITFADMTAWVGRIIHRPTLALEGPNRVLVWEDHEGVWMTRDTMQHYLRYIAGRHEAQTNQGNLRLHEDKVAAMIDNVAR